MGSDNPPPPAGRLKARNKAQLIRALVVTLAVALLIYLTSDVADLNDGVPSATGPEPGPEYPPPARANSAKGAALEHAGDKFPTRSYARQDAMRRREDREVTGGSVSVKRSSGGEEAGAKAAVHEPLPVPPPKPVYHGLYDLSALDIKARALPGAPHAAARRGRGAGAVCSSLSRARPVTSRRPLRIASPRLAAPARQTHLPPPWNVLPRRAASARALDPRVPSFRSACLPWRRTGVVLQTVL